MCVFIALFVKLASGKLPNGSSNRLRSKQDRIMQTELEHLRKLPVADKLRIVEQLWDDIGESEEPLLLQDWHKAEAERRASELEANPDIALTRQQLWERVEQAHG